MKFVLDESSYTVKTIEIEKSEINLQNLDSTDFTIKEDFTLETITKILKSANSLKSETVRFIVKDGKIICKIETEIAEAEHKLSDIFDNSEDFDLTFATSYLSVIPKYQKFFLKATRKNNPILIFLKYSTLVKFRVNIEYMSYIQCYLAPRIEESDDDEEYSDDIN